MEASECDFALIGIDRDDVFLAGPFDHATEALKLLSRDLLAAQSGAASAVIQCNPDTQRATVMVASQVDDSYVTVAYVMFPVPPVEGLRDVYRMTDIGLWENELAEPDADPQ